MNSTADASSPVMRVLPGHIREPYVFLSLDQRAKCEQIPALAFLSPMLPGWVPQSLVSDALGFGHTGIQRALHSLGGRPYVWATEFENVHDVWSFHEPAITVDGVNYSCCESFYHAQKPVPFDSTVWISKRLSVMRRAVYEKFAASPDARSVLLQSYPHPLLSLKHDDVWGFHPESGGQNLLAKILMELRAELVSAQSLLLPAVVEDCGGMGEASAALIGDLRPTYETTLWPTSKLTHRRVAAPFPASTIGEDAVLILTGGNCIPFPPPPLQFQLYSVAASTSFCLLRFPCFSSSPSSRFFRRDH